MKKWILIALLIPACAFAQYKKSVAVLDMQTGAGVGDLISSLIVEYFRTSVGNNSEYHVLGGPALVERLTQKAPNAAELLAVQNRKNAEAMGPILGVSKVIFGTMQKTDDTYTVTLNMVDVQDNRLFTTVTEKYSGDEALLTEQLDAYVVKLFEEEKGLIARLASKEKKREAMLQSMFAVSSRSGRTITAGAGYGLITGVNDKNVGFVDFIKLGYMKDRILFLLDLQKSNQTLHSFDSTDYREKETFDYSGIGLTVGYEWLDLLYGWVKVTPGVVVGFYSYDYEDAAYDTIRSATIPYESKTASVTDTASAFAGAHLGIDVGHQITDNIGAYGYGIVKFFYLSDIILRMDFGLKMTYSF